MRPARSVSILYTRSPLARPSLARSFFAAHLPLSCSCAQFLRLFFFFFSAREPRLLELSSLAEEFRRWTLGSQSRKASGLPLRSSLFALPSSLSLFPLPLPSPSSSSSWQRPHVSDLRGPQPAAEHQGKLQLFCTRAGRGAASLRQQESKAPARPAAVYDMTCIRETGAAPAARCPIPNASAPCNHSHQSYPVFPAERARWLAGWPSRGARGVWSPTTEGGKSKRSLFRTRHDNSRGKEATPRVDRRLPQLRVPGEFAAPSLSGAHVSRA